MKLLESILNPRKAAAECAEKFREQTTNRVRKQVSRLLGPHAPKSLNPVKFIKEWFWKGVQSIFAKNPGGGGGNIKMAGKERSEGSEDSLVITSNAEARQSHPEGKTSDDKPQVSKDELEMTPEELQEAEVMEKKVAGLINTHRSEFSGDLPQFSEQDAELKNMADERVGIVGAKPSKELEDSHHQAFMDKHQVVENLGRGFESPEVLFRSWKKSVKGHHEAMLCNADRFALSIRKGKKFDGSGTCWYGVLLLKKGDGAPNVAEKGSLKVEREEEVV